MIFIVADHGNPWGSYGLKIPEGFSKGDVSKKTVSAKVVGSAMPLFLFKSFNSKPEDLKFSFAPISLSDIPELVFKDLNIKSKNTRSLSQFIEGKSKSRTRFFKYYNFKHKYWRKEYLPEMTLYKVIGPSWKYNSWEQVTADKNQDN